MIDYSGRGDYMNYIPANKFVINVDSAEVLRNGTVKEYFKDRIVSPMIWEYSATNAFKGDLAIMDMFSINNWERPVYFSTTVPSEQYKGLDKYFVQEGLAYRVVPITTDKRGQGEFGMMDPLLMYDNLMNKFSWGNADDPSVYLDENNRRMFSNFRRQFASLGDELLLRGDTAKAVEAAHRGLEIVPVEKLPADFFAIGLAEVLIRTGNNDEGEKLLIDIIEYAKEYLDYAISIKPEERFGMEYPTGINMQALLDIYEISEELNLSVIRSIVEPDLSRYYSVLYSVN
jgi:tetratricopeptide (TPR) repeat protein